MDNQFHGYTAYIFLDSAIIMKILFTSETDTQVYTFLGWAL